MMMNDYINLTSVSPHVYSPVKLEVMDDHVRVSELKVKYKREDMLQLHFVQFICRGANNGSTCFC